MGITWHLPPFNGGFLWLVKRQSNTVLKAFKANGPVLATMQGIEMMTVFADLSSMNWQPFQH